MARKLRAERWNDRSHNQTKQLPGGDLSMTTMIGYCSCTQTGLPSDAGTPSLASFFLRARIFGYLHTWFAGLCCAISLAGVSHAFVAQSADVSPRFSISFPAARSAEPLDGRLLLLLSTDPS